MLSIMKNLSIAIAVLFCLGCNNAKLAAKKESKYANLLALYKIINIDTLKIFTIENLDSVGYEFKGTKIDTSLFSLLPKKILQDTMPVYSIYKFNLDSLRTGLITRTPGEYKSSSIKLLIYDKQKDAISDYFELSELVGNDGNTLEKTAWLYRGQDKIPMCFLKEEFTHDRSVEDENDTTVTATNNYYLVGFKKNKHDTIDKKAGYLFEKFKRKR
jgi:hypothetical protein